MNPNLIWGSLKQKKHGHLRALITDELGRFASAAFDALTAAQRSVIVNLISRDPWQLVDDKTNEAVSGNLYYPDQEGIRLGDHDQWTFQLLLVENDIDVEGWIGEDTDYANAKPITLSFKDLNTGLNLTGTMVGSTGANFVIDFRGIGLTHVRFHSAARTNATNSTEIRDVSRKA